MNELLIYFGLGVLSVIEIILIDKTEKITVNGAFGLFLLVLSGYFGFFFINFFFLLTCEKVIWRKKND